MVTIKLINRFCEDPVSGLYGPENEAYHFNAEMVEAITYFGGEVTIWCNGCEVIDLKIIGNQHG